MLRAAVYKDRDLQIIFGVTLMAVLGVTSVTPAFPKIQQIFSITPGAVGMLVTAYTFPGVFLTPFLGILADRFGRKRILLPSLFVFGIAGGMCSLVRDFPSLVVLRVIQGIGGASLGSLNITLIGDVYSGSERTSAMGYNASVLSAGTAVYPAVGGALATVGWFYPFTLSLVAIPVGIMVLFLREPPTGGGGGLSRHLGDLVQTLKDRRVLALSMATLLTFVILYGSHLTYLPFLLQGGYDASSLLIGVIMSVMSIVAAFVSSQIGNLSKSTLLWVLMKGAFILYGLALFIIAISPGIIFVVIGVSVFGIAHGINIPTIQTLLVGLSSPTQRASFMAINATILRIGQTMGPILMGIIMGRLGISMVFYMGASLAILTLVILSALRS